MVKTDLVIKGVTAIVCFFAAFRSSNGYLGDDWIPEKFRNEVLKPTSEKCIEKQGTSRDVIAKVKSGNLEDTDEIEKYLLCVFEELDLIDRERHEFEYWKIMTMVPNEIKKTIFLMNKDCHNIAGSDYAKASFEFVKCLHRCDPDHFAFLF